MNQKRKNYVVKSILKEEIRKYFKEYQGKGYGKGTPPRSGQGRRLPQNIKPEALHDELGIPENKLVDDYSVDELVSRQKKAIGQKKENYQTMIRRLNWQQVMNKTKNPEVTRKFRSVMKKLRAIYKK